MNNRVLIVDDSRVIREMLKDTLRGEEFAIIEAVDGSEAMRVFSVARPDLILLDVNMPAPNGLEVLRSLKSKPETRDIPVVMVTANGDDEDVAKALELGANDYIVKPFSEVIVRARVRSVLRQQVLFEDKVRLLEEKHLLNKEYHAQQQHHEALLNHLADGVVTTDAQGRVVHFSLGAQKIFGYRPPEIVGMSVDALVAAAPGESGKRTPSRPFLDIAELVGQRRHLRGARNDRTTFPLELTVREMWDDEGLTYICTARDLTEQKKIEAVLREASRNAQAANRSKSEFLTNMSHEMRTPLTAILGFGETLLTEGDIRRAPPQRVEAIRTIIRNGEHLLHLINEILDLSKIESGRMEVQLVPYSPFLLAAELHALMAARAKAKDLVLEIDHDGALPEQIQTDPLRLRQILVNLVGNAVKFTKTGSIRVVFSFVHPKESQPMLQIDVIDSGMGIDEEQLGKLFKPFTQINASPHHQYEGTGLGLTISKRFAEMLGGDITVESEPEKGSTFRVTVTTGPLQGTRMLDRAPEHLANQPLRVVPPEKPRGAAPLDCRVLLAEDGDDNRRLIAFVLEKAGARITTAENGEIAFQKAMAAQEQGNPFDSILMDMQMPVLDGYEATRKLRAAGYQGTIIALTAHAMEGDRRKCLDAGCTDYTTKPINRRTLLEIVARYARPSAVPREEIAKNKQ